ncbi:sec-independent translocase [Thermostaphylospora chromogena]|uniref:Sec-independent protein translocase protein TatB n=1 Tax=Thermostaphylospora chromogena TaxID=35622 RepID=A0A1H1AZT4_9ACTN|nr:sec-independent translocase [Thermostaphylospora chromogena]SDQ45152.1 sec-independent protein translocase protein TatB [Thermostaphylospora chromogena]
MFGLGTWEIVTLVVIALLVFGPEKLPQAAAQAGRTLRNLRRMANNAKEDLRAGLGPEFADFDPADLNPKNFVRRHLFEDDDDLDRRKNVVVTREPDPKPELAYGEIPPYDHEAT